MTDWLYLTIVTGTPPAGTVPERTFLGWLILEIPEIILGHQALKAGIDFLVVEIINCMETQQVRSGLTMKQYICGQTCVYFAGAVVYNTIQLAETFIRERQEMITDCKYSQTVLLGL